MPTCPSCTTVLELDAAFCGQCGARVRARRKTLVGAELDGRFRIDAKLAEGGFGSIYRATHLPSQQVVALKVLHAELAADASLAARFRREGETLSRLSSPHTVTAYEVGETNDGTLFIAMELLRGESLLDRFRAHGPLPWRGVLEIMKQVCRSLGEAHALGIVHRDLKPANIHLGDDDYVKVLDFGIAKLMRGSESDDGDELTRVGQAVGTLEYMAPEQLIGAACDGRADLYALGVLIYEMLTGRRPYADATGPTSLVAAVMTEPLLAPSALLPGGCIPVAVDELVLRCLARDPNDRFADVDDVIGAIDASLASFTDDDATWIELPQLIITPSRQPVMQADAGLGFEATHMQAAIAPTTSPGVGQLRAPVTPSRAPTDIGAITPRGLARGSSSPMAPYHRARGPSDRETLGRPFADGSRVRSRFAPGEANAAPGNQANLAPGGQVHGAPAPTGSLPLVELAPAIPVPAELSAPQAPILPAPTVMHAHVRPLSARRVALWTMGLLVGGAGIGAMIASLVG